MAAATRIYLLPAFATDGACRAAMEAVGEEASSSSAHKARSPCIAREMLSQSPGAWDVV